jgi:phage shock protein E
MRLSTLAAALLALAGCSSHRVSPHKAKALVEAGARLVDVRTVEEFASGHLSGAVNIPVSELERRLTELGPKGQPVVVYCASGFRSASAAKTLTQAGFGTVADLGSMDDWPK